MDEKTMERITTGIWKWEIPRDEKFVFLAYADSLYKKNDFNVSTIARKTGYSERRVRKITKKLEKRGILDLGGLKWA